MTDLGLLHLGSLFYLSGVICLAVSLNENRGVRRIIRETVELWAKFLALTLVLALIVHFLSR